MNGATNTRLGIAREVLYEKVIDRLAEGVLLIDLDSKAIVDANPAIAAMLGYTVSELTALSVYDIVAHTRDQVDKTAQLALELGQHLLPRRRYRRKDGTLIQVEVTVNRIEVAGRHAAFVIVRDLAEKIAFEHRLRDMLLYDAMTGLPTSVALRDHAEHALSLAASGGRQLAYIVLDINKFSAVNERFGLTAGDQMIAHVSHRLATELKGYEVIARLQGGDEFGILFAAENGATSVRNMADGIAAVFDRAFVLGDGAKISVTSSVGAALFPGHGTTFDELAHRASIAMKRARTQRVHCVLYDPAHEPFGDFGFDISVELPRAINENLLSLVFQPIVRTAMTDHCIGAEALVRWHHDQIGSLPPGYFVPAAEEANVIRKLDRWVIENVIAQIAAWRATFPEVWISANVSARTLGEEGLVDWVTSTLQSHGVPPRCLMLEITETAAMMNRDSVVSVLAALREAGIRIALDDFGTGYSSLAYLKHIPVDVVKIDREFVTGIGSDARDEHTVKTVVRLLRGIHCELLAEGVETEAQRDWLNAIGIEMIQGYWIARPEPAHGMAKYFSLAQTPPPVACNDDRAAVSSE